MGIRGLTHRLAHKGRRVTLDSVSGNATGISNSETSQCYTLIDGPSLAYFAYHQVHQDEDARAQGAHCYGPVVEQFIEILDRIATSGFTIKHVYFDGGLPEHKIETRVERLAQFAGRSKLARERCQEKMKTNGKVEKGHHAEVLQQMIASFYSTQAHGFMVAAVIEALSRSRYARETQVVAGEADAFCALAARSIAGGGDKQIWIFTNDSDMLVYDCGPATRICMLSSVDLTSSTQIHASIYDTQQLAESFGHHSMLQIAYMMDQDPMCSLETAARRANEGSFVQLSAYRAFATQYDMPNARSANLNHRQEQHLRFMDPRVAEIMYQLDAMDTVQQPAPLRMFLPPMFDDTSRASAWAIACDIRRLAYQVLLCSHNISRKVHEYDRKGENIVATDVDLDADLYESLEVLSVWLNDTMHPFQQDNNAVRWRLVALVFIVDFKSRHEKAMPTFQQANIAFSGSAPKSWDEIHLQSQYDAVLYSLRMLGLATSFAVSSQGYRGQSIPQSVRRLDELLIPMPELQTMMQNQEDSLTESLRRRIRMVLSNHGIHDRSTDRGAGKGTVRVSTGTKRPPKRRKVEASESSGNRIVGSNRFGMLQD